MNAVNSERNLQSWPLQCEYRSGTDNLATDFYQPLLRRSITYDRAVGYFTSQALVIAAQGLRTFIEGQGTMRLVASPHLTEEDISAISRGYDQRDIITNAVSRQLEWTEDKITTNALGFLAWLVAEKRLEIRLGLPVDSVGRARKGLYHEKMGIFEDAYGNRVAFSGSANETGSAFGENFESIDVFWSWDDPHGRVARKVSNFDRLWRDLTPGLSVVPFPEVALDKLRQYKPTHLPDDTPSTHPAPWSVSRPLRSAQVSALEAWYSHGRRGILSMATGSGKTYTSLIGARSTPDAESIVIAVPSVALVNQWANECVEAGLVSSSEDLVVAAGASFEWTAQLNKQLSNPNRQGPLVIVGTMRTLSGSKFTAFAPDLQSLGNSLLIVDEVHNSGAPRNQACLQDHFTYRLGLSATPIRPFDDHGTETVLTYFGGVVFEYDLAAAIHDGLLCPYDYHVWFAVLSDDEMDEYRKLSTKIAGLQSQIDQRPSASDQQRATSMMESLLMKRARIVKECRNKLDVLPQVLAECRLDKTLVYCSDENQLEEASKIVTKLSIPFGRYTSTLDSRAREQLLTAFSQGYVNALLAIKCLDEGVDIPAVDEAIVVASSRSEREFIQRRGRILRASRGKVFASLHDLFVLPPTADDESAKGLINRELARAHAMLGAARNKYAVEDYLDDVLRPYGLRLSEILGIGGTASE